MQYLFSFGIILCVSLAGEMLNRWIPLPIPASVYGLLIMLALLMTGAVKPDKIRRTAYQIIDWMSMMFVPACVGLMDVFDQLLPVALPFVVISLASTVLVLGVSGRVTQRVIRAGKDGEHD